MKITLKNLLIAVLLVDVILLGIFLFSRKGGGNNCVPKDANLITEENGEFTQVFWTYGKIAGKAKEGNGQFYVPLLVFLNGECKEVSLYLGPADFWIGFSKQFYKVPQQSTSWINKKAKEMAAVLRQGNIVKVKIMSDIDVDKLRRGGKCNKLCERRLPVLTRYTVENKKLRDLLIGKEGGLPQIVGPAIEVIVFQNL